MTVTVTSAASTLRPPVDLNAVREVSRAITAAHLVIYSAPEAAEEAANLG